MNINIQHIGVILMSTSSQEKISKYDYIMNLIPAIHILDEVEKYAIQNNKYGNFSAFGNDKKLFFYTDSEDSKNESIDTGLYRAIFKIYCEVFDKNYITVNSTNDEYEFLYLDEDLNDITNDIDKITYLKDNICYIVVLTDGEKIYANNLEVIDVDLSITGVAF